jgi:hypothetical protein
VAAGPRFLHLQPGLLHVGGGEQVTVQGAFGRQLAQPFTDLIIDHLVQLRPGLGPVAVADRTGKIGSRLAPRIGQKQRSSRDLDHGSSR